MLTSEQLEMRARGLGASEIGTVAGLNPFQASISVWLEKTKRAEPFRGNSRTKRGDLMEPHIRAWWADRRGATDLEIPGTLRDPKNEWLFATPDQIGTVNGERMLCEAKYVGWRVVDRWPIDEVPDYVLAQTTIQQHVTGIHRCDVAAWLECDEHEIPERIIETPYSPELAEALIEVGREFWFEHVLKDRPPAVDASKAWGTYLAKRFPRDRGPIIEATEEADAIVARLFKAKADMARAEMAKDEAENELKALIGDNAGIERWKKWRVTWKRDARGLVSWKKVAEAAGASQSLIDSHTGEPFRRFLAKEF